MLYAADGDGCLKEIGMIMTGAAVWYWTSSGAENWEELRWKTRLTITDREAMNDDKP